MARVAARAVIPAPPGTCFSPAATLGWPQPFGRRLATVILTGATVASDGLSVELQLEIDLGFLEGHITTVAIAPGKPDQ